MDLIPTHVHVQQIMLVHDVKKVNFSSQTVPISCLILVTMLGVPTRLYKPAC